MMHHAALGQQLAALESLLDRGLNPNERTTKGLTPVHLAVHAGSTECVQLLAKRGADVTATDSVSEARGRVREGLRWFRDTKTRACGLCDGMVLAASLARSLGGPRSRWR